MEVLCKKFVTHRAVRKTYIILGLVALTLILLWGRVFYGSMQSYKQGEIFLEDRKYLQAVTYYDRSIRWYTPLNPYVLRSAERLWKIGEIAEREGDIQLSLIAYRTIRGGFYAVSHVVLPGKGWIAKCDKKIDDLMAHDKRAANGKGESSSKSTSPQNKKSEAPSIFWSILVEVGFLGWVGSVIGFIMIPLRRREKARTLIYSIFKWAAPMVFFYGIWILGMMKA